jgi:hypothetical protein
MATLESIIEEVLLNVEGYIGDQDIYGTLDDAIESTDSSFVVAGPSFQTGSGFATGLVEVGDELIYVQEIDGVTGTFSSVLRGFRGSEAKDWAAGTRVRNNPRFPIIAVKRAINDIIKSLYPRVFAVKTTEFIVNGSVSQYNMPADTINVLSIHYRKPGASGTWLPVPTWNFENRAASNSSTGKAVNIYKAVAGYPVQVTYIVEPTELTYGDEYATVTGLPEYTRDVVVLGACARLTMFIDSARLANTTAEQAMMNPSGNFGNAAGTQLSKYFFGLYQQRLLEAETRQKTEFTPQRHSLR